MRWMSNVWMFLLLRWFGTRSTSHEIYQEKEEKMEATKMAQKWQESDPKIQKGLERDTKMTRKWHKNDWKVTHKWRVVPVERAVALAGGLGVAQRSRGSTCIGKTLGKHWKTFGNAPTPGQVPISHLSKCTRYLLCLCRPMVVYFLCSSMSS